MQKIMIIGNLTKDPELRVTQDGKSVCNFTVAVNKRTGDHPEADYFRVSAWEKIADNCARFLEKGKKVCVIGSVSLEDYKRNDGCNKSYLQIRASEVEFLR